MKYEAPVAALVSIEATSVIMTSKEICDDNSTPEEEI